MIGCALLMFAPLKCSPSKSAILNMVRRDWSCAQAAKKQR
jgi:hypothetical protein